MELAQNNSLSPTKLFGNVRHIVLFIGSLMTVLVNNPESHKGHRGCLGCPAQSPQLKHPQASLGIPKEHQILASSFFLLTYSQHLSVCLI